MEKKLIFPTYDDSYTGDSDIIEKRTTEPIKKIEDINRIYQYFIERKKYRNAALFIIGINVGLRIGDLIQLKLGQFYDRMWTPIRDIYIIEGKTSRTRGDKRVIFTQKTYRQLEHLDEKDMLKVLYNMVNEAKTQCEKNKDKRPEERYIYANDMVFEALELLRKNSDTPMIRDDYLFRNESRNSTGENKPMHPSSAWRAIEGACQDLGIGFTVATHGLRKTFGYHFMEAYGRTNSALQTLQRLFNHSSPVITLKYIGIETEDFARGYQDVGARYQLKGQQKNNGVQFPVIGDFRVGGM